MGRMKDDTNILALAKYNYLILFWLKPICLLFIIRPINGTAIDTYRRNKPSITLVYAPNSPILHNSSSVKALFFKASMLSCNCFTELVPTITELITG